MNLFAQAAKPMPAFIPREALIENLQLYRSTPAQIAAMLEALADAMQSEHYRHEGKISDALHDEGEQVADAAASLRTAFANDENLHSARCACDACIVARGEAQRDRELDESLLKAA